MSHKKSPFMVKFKNDTWGQNLAIQTTEPVIIQTDNASKFFSKTYEIPDQKYKKNSGINSENITDKFSVFAINDHLDRAGIPHQVNENFIRNLFSLLGNLEGGFSTCQLFRKVLSNQWLPGSFMQRNTVSFTESGLPEFPIILYPT